MMSLYVVIGQGKCGGECVNFTLYRTSSKNRAIDKGQTHQFQEGRIYVGLTDSLQVSARHREGYGLCSNRKEKISKAYSEVSEYTSLGRREGSFRRVKGDEVAEVVRQVLNASVET